MGSLCNVSKILTIYDFYCTYIEHKLTARTLYIVQTKTEKATTFVCQLCERFKDDNIMNTCIAVIVDI